METKQPKRRVPELDGLRGIAILLVLVFHYISQGGTNASGSVAAFLQRFVIMGWTGVDLFFVLSGFLIGGILIDARDSPTYFKAFYVRRFFRIIPIYYLWIVLYLGVMGVAGAQVARLSNSGNRPPINFGVFGHFLFLQNIIGSDFAGIAGAWFGHLWSLAVEEQFKGAIVTVLAAFVTYGVAKMSWVLFEGPLQRRGHAFKY